MAVLLTAACLSGGCASPVEINDRFAADNGLIRSIINGTDFSHVVYLAPDGQGKIWHVYLEGDGQPWQSRTSVAHDPTSAKPLMLRLIQQDAAPRIYLGRPCYLGLAVEAQCSPWVWTHGRYSDAVVTSMQVALERLIERHAISELVLIGHSGGGTLAILLAERIRQTKIVLTLAGNLDTRVWTHRHGYTELTGSLNPADRPELPNRIKQFHFLGAEDRNLTYEMFGKSTDKPSGRREFVIDGVGHTSGWELVYCDILSRIGGGCLTQ